VVVLDALPRPLRVGAQVQAVVREVREGSSAPIPPSGGVLMGTAGAADFLRALQPGDRLTIRIDLQGDGAAQWRTVQEAVAGGPWLIRNGKIVAPEEMPGGFNLQTFIERRHPRTAVGRTKQGEVLWITVDGRQPHSQGASLSELAQIMARYGAVDAINLDGGGSTTLVVRNLIVNSPSDGTERPVSNAWLVYDDAQRPTLPRYTDYRIDPPQASLKVGEQVRFRILRGEQPVSTWEAVWGTVEHRVCRPVGAVPRVAGRARGNQRVHRRAVAARACGGYRRCAAANTRWECKWQLASGGAGGNRTHE
jgi:hypothetical protein